MITAICNGFVQWEWEERAESFWAIIYHHPLQSNHWMVAQEHPTWDLYIYLVALLCASCYLPCYCHQTSKLLG